MEIRITRTTEYVLDVADDDSIILGEVDAILHRHQLTGDDMAARVAEVYYSDHEGCLIDLSAMAEVVEDSWVCDSADGPEPDDMPDDEDEDEDEDETAQVLTFTRQ